MKRNGKVSKITVRLPQSIATELSAQAVSQSTSLSGLIVAVLRRVPHETMIGDEEHRAAVATAKKMVLGLRPGNKLSKRERHHRHVTDLFALGSQGLTRLVAEVRDDEIQLRLHDRYPLRSDELEECEEIR
jgi:hypothetical protein